MNPLLISDAYKQSHRVQYPKGTTLVYSNFTPRSDKHAKIKGGVVVFGIQAFLKSIESAFLHDFFKLPLEQVKEDFVKHYTAYFGASPDTSHLEDLHELGYLPIEIKALPEGTFCPIGVPLLTIKNTLPEFFWVTNFLETIISTELWMPITSATIAKGYKDILTKWSDRTCDNGEHLPFQAHDFSMRGMAGLGASMASGAGHLLFFVGSDTIPAVEYMTEYYGADVEKELVACSVPATEHSVMSMGTREDEISTFRRLITEAYPTGIISIVSDTWDLWKVLTEYLPQLKEEVLARDGKVVIRPDSGDPINIICGYEGYSIRENKVYEWGILDGQGHGEFEKGMYEVKNMKVPKVKGVIELLWDTFGGTINSKGYKVLNEKIGAIYGDSITPERAEEICSRLEQKGFASSNIVFGVGSYTYQFNTRDTYGLAMKATYGEVNGIGREIYKDPVTDDGTKKSAKGLLHVTSDLKLIDQCNWQIEGTGMLQTVYKNGSLVNPTTLSKIRERLNK